MARLAISIVMLAASCGVEPGREAPRAAAQPGVGELLGGSLFVSRDERRILEEHALAGELARTLGALPGVADARVHLSLADRSVLSRDRTAKSRAAVVLVARGEDGPREEEVARILEAAVPDLAAGDVEVVLQRLPGRASDLVRVGPLLVHSSSAGLAKGLLAVLLLACLALAAGLVFAGTRLLRVRRYAGPPGRDDEGREEGRA